MAHSNRYENKIVIVTGAAQGIGRGVATAIAAEGGQVVLVDRSELVAEVALDIQKVGLPALTSWRDRLCCNSVYESCKTLKINHWLGMKKTLITPL